MQKTVALIILDLPDRRSQASASLALHLPSSSVACRINPRYLGDMYYCPGNGYAAFASKQLSVPKSEMHKALYIAFPAVSCSAWYLAVVATRQLREILQSRREGPETAPESRHEAALVGHHKAPSERNREAVPESRHEAAAAEESRRKAALASHREAAPERRSEVAAEICREPAPAGHREPAPESRRETSSRPRLGSEPLQCHYAVMDATAAESEDRSEDLSDGTRPTERSRYSPYAEPRRDHQYLRDNDHYDSESAVRDFDYGRRGFSHEHSPYYPSQPDTGHYSRRSQSPPYGGRSPMYYQRRYLSPSAQAGPSRRPYQDSYHHAHLLSGSSPFTSRCISSPALAGWIFARVLSSAVSRCSESRLAAPR
ncbi:hypothetical protein FIBSPDRAFT_883706 [Athelia psychrophila]|uniref:Uncharacterized protein n=1 Tax=Athelia psychrophila TaxID=1759441 RepID=A0A166TUL4_9AGAM|nr:hypothetical protein FIBSPDRAFT_883706 [Fibularhizoctonia sp. CBS 109695]